MRGQPGRSGPDDSMISRRGFIGLAAAAAVAVATKPDQLLAADASVCRLTLDNCHTGETLSVVYCERGCYRREALAEIDTFLRDFRTGEVRAIDPCLLDLLHDLSVVTGTRKPFQVISGYRSPRTNAMLRERGPGVAARSLHTVGKAIDVRLGDVPTRTLHDAALRLRRGGVGYYPGPDFVHVDTGRIRSW